VVGVTVGTMALIIVLSVFNGFEELVLSLFNSFNPDFKVEAAEGKVFNASDIPRDELLKIPGVIGLMEVVEENALVKYEDKQHVVRVKGVGDGYLEHAPLKDFIISGQPDIGNSESPAAVIGAGVAYRLSLYLGDYNSFINLYVPDRTRSGYAGISENAFVTETVPVKGVFALQQDFDGKYVILPIGIARKLLKYNDEVTSLEITISPERNSERVQQEIIDLLGPEYVVKNRFQQQSLLYQVMQSEKWATFIILAFILVIATFNVIGSLSILIIDKKKDISVLWSMGADKRLIKRIFIAEGMMISIFGGIAGLLAGGALALLQQHFGFVTLGGPEDSYIISAYPVRVLFIDFVLVLATVVLIGAVTVWFPVRQISRRILATRLNFFLMR
jgi:ABC-type lipoprotein release transport system permease subunit